MTAYQGAPSGWLRGVRNFCRGTAAGPIVEFAIIVPVLLLLVFGIVDFARAFLERNKVVAGARIGARSGAVISTLCTDPNAAITYIKATVNAYFVGNNYAAPAANDITVSPFDFCDNAALAPNITVGIQNYRFNPVTPLLGMLGANVIRLQARATYRWEYAP